MTIMFDDFESLKRRVEELTRKRDRASGELKAAISTLKKEFGCSSIEEAKEMLTEMEKRERQLAKKYTKAKQEFEELLPDE